ncbi:hypothetical protein C9374_007850 [Naegleria lovaniensis]|uniref:Microbial-type PARG catalytic domain-containing protein n=1 Tax=Naegleria lovaniensis TaxID=51637 RepID=A0AA88KFW4_NAELO|nr:uncharacterized protein C9374_007850 [Naegleria lovaniensis]KAG2378702.1 hypothetical protein C9374_007850 [Naegleria lovaniensis]
MISNPTTTDQIIDVSPIPDSFYDNICEYYEELIDHPDKYLFNARQWLHWFHHYQNESDTYALKLMRRVIQSGTLYAFRTLQFVVPSCNDDEQILEMIDSNQNSEGIPSVHDSSIFKGKEKHIRKDILINKEELIQSACHVQCYSDQLAAKCIAESLRVKPVFGKTSISIVEGDCLEVAIHVMMKQRTLSLIDSTTTTTTGIINSSSSSAVLNLPTVMSPSKNNKTQRKSNSSNTSNQSTTSPLPPFKLALLNMASSKRPGGGYREGAGSQEENLFRRTSLAFSLEDIRFV